MNNSTAIMLHSTYFELEMGSSQAIRDSYMATCREFLSGSKGMMSFWVGEIAEDMDRPVNDKQFHIAMNQLFESKAMFDIYNGADPRHEQFVDEVNRWAVGTTRRVLDSFLHTLNYAGDGPSSGIPVPPDKKSSASRMMHSAYFKLTDNSVKSVEKYLSLCNQYLSDHPGVCMYASGKLADMGRDVSITNYDAEISILWRTKKYYDEYLQSQEHKDFLAATDGMIQDTYVFDSFVQAAPIQITK